MHDRKSIARHFQDAEASFLIEGLDLGADALYQALKARVIGGEIGADESIRLAVEYSREIGQPAQSDIAAAAR